MLCRHSSLEVSLNPGVGQDEHAWVPGGSKLVREGGDRLSPALPFQLRGHLLIGTRGRRGQVPGHDRPGHSAGHKRGLHLPWHRLLAG
jgi:hypothetical protein